MTLKYERQNSFGWLIAVMSHVTTKTFAKKLQQHNLSLALWPTLMCLWEREGLTQQELTELANVRRSTTTRTLDKLQKLGLIVRQPHPDSRRSFLIYLTDKGRALQDEILPIPTRLNQQVLAPLTASESKQLIATLQKLVRQLDRD